MDFKSILKKYKYRLTFTLLLILFETMLGLLFPLFIGEAIGDALKLSYSGSIKLGLLGIILILIGGFRRLIDSRFYAGIYTEASIEAVKVMQNKDTSVKSARLNMLGEMVEFAENQIPDIVQQAVGLIGVTIIIAFLNFKIFLLSAGTGVVIFLIYFISGNKTLFMNSQINNQMENQVNILKLNNSSMLKEHLKKLMIWNIRLSDLETVNYSVGWFFMMILLLLSIIISTNTGEIEYGALFSLIMYVYQFIESVASLPLYYQQWLRLNEITSRLKTI